MRLWSLHPKYLDKMGLLALWKEGIGGLKALKSKNVKGYYNHPQLERFKNSIHPSFYLRQYLNIVWQEASLRGYNFNRQLIMPFLPHDTLIPVSNRQLIYEFSHLQKKLKVRDMNKFIQNCVDTRIPEHHPIFTIYEGEIESWERIIKSSPKRKSTLLRRKD